MSIWTICHPSSILHKSSFLFLAGCSLSGFIFFIVNLTKVLFQLKWCWQLSYWICCIGFYTYTTNIFWFACLWPHLLSNIFGHICPLSTMNILSKGFKQDKCFFGSHKPAMYLQLTFNQNISKQSQISVIF